MKKLQARLHRVERRLAALSPNGGQVDRSRLEPASYGADGSGGFDGSSGGEPIIVIAIRKRQGGAGAQAGGPGSRSLLGALLANQETPPYIPPQRYSAADALIAFHDAIRSPEDLLGANSSSRNNSLPFPAGDGAPLPPPRTTGPEVF